MKTRLIFSILLSFLLSIPAHAQNLQPCPASESLLMNPQSDLAPDSLEQVSNLSVRPEFTVRYFTGFFSEGGTVTAAANINDWFSLGIAGGRSRTYYGAYPYYAFSYQAGLYMRGCLHLGSRHISSFYLDLLPLANYCYYPDLNTFIVKYGGDSQSYDNLSMKYGDIWGGVTIEPGFRVRLYRNFQLFLGVLYTASRHDSVGVHIGFGF